MDIIEDEEEEEEAEAEAAVALAKATLWKLSNKSHVWCSTLLAAAVMTSILSSKYDRRKVEKLKKIKLGETVK